MSQQINLVNPLLLKRRFVVGLREMALGLGLILVAALAWAGYQHYQAGVLETRAAQQEARKAQAQQVLDRLTAAATRPASMLLAERVKLTQVQVAQREALLAAIGGTLDTNSTGFSSRLRALAHGSPEGVWLNGLTLSPGYVALKGSALNAGLLTTYMDRLGQQPPFAGMKFSGMNAALAQPAGEGKAQAAPPNGHKAQTAAAPLGHIDFALYAGSPKKAAEQGKSNAQ